jgi:GT2 family glycosyltransferase
VVSGVAEALSSLLVQSDLVTAEGAVVSRAPVALFVYNRPDHTRQTVAALAANRFADETPLHVFSDAPRHEVSRQSVEDVRSFIRTITGFQSVTIIERPTNYGLARSIIDGVTGLCEKYGCVIVVEDDLVTSSRFLSFMNEALTCYERDARVVQISGHIAHVPEFARRTEALFVPFVTSWGWGTWERAWKLFEPSAQGWEKIRDDGALRKRFNLDDHFDYATMLQMQLDGKIDSWAIRWYLSVFLKGGMALFPPRSFVRNIGFDSGTHGSRVLRWTLSRQPISEEPVSFPTVTQIIDHDYALVKKALFRQMGGQLGAMFRWVRRRLASGM